ncbi:PEGA domain-containing protein [Kaistella flava (ex Peng et al. 2021)]|uniref:PEGA domain-containing protein n=1 Tax=Kaistella flava (ex Peng et al. 2021) TaxID=2038776 RepID=A0A7M2YBB6_9FLAO|nr:PEGA domain-containing protein [Kaistella flava (ex Peng et al. 2021)]QOW11416.1 PEGA domain-containing protein [Kaistella flava (ex Peng et al. 2021)]
MKKVLSYASVAIIAISMTSCATIFTGTKDSITFNSTPEGAKVVHKGIEKCVTPCTVDITRSLSKQMIEIKKEGYETKEVKLDKDFNPVTLVNLLFGGIIGFGIDLGSGSFVKYADKSHKIELAPKQ